MKQHWKKSIVCSDIDSFHEIFDEKKLVFELDNLESLIISIQKAYELKEEYGIKAYEKAKSKFTAEVMANNHLYYYKKILNYEDSK